MAAQTENNYISVTTIDSAEIPTAILGFSTMPNFYAIYHSSKDVSIFGLGGHIAISGCWSLSQSFGDTLFYVAVVGS